MTHQSSLMSTIAIIQLILMAKRVTNTKIRDCQINRRNPLANQAVAMAAQNRNHLHCRRRRRYRKALIQKVNEAHGLRAAQHPKNQKVEKMESHHVSILPFLKSIPKLFSFIQRFRYILCVAINKH